MSKVVFTGATDPSTPASGKVVVFARPDGQMYSMDDTGTVAPLSIPGTQEEILGGWTDLEMSLIAAASGGGAPSLQPFGPSGNSKQWRFSIGDSVYTAGHVNHDIKAGSTVYPHVHWSTDGVSVNTVKWELNFTIAAGHNQANFPVDQTVTLEEAGAGSAWRHMVTEDAVGLIAPEVDSLIILEVKRITNGGTNNTDDVFGLYVDFHIETDRYTTVNRLPPFYS